MKKLLLSIGMCLLVVGVSAQKILPDQLVVSPKYIGDVVEEETVKKSPICCFIQNHLVIPDDNSVAEGYVGVVFTINPDGSLSNFIVSNKVTSSLDEAVVNCIKKTEGKWQPGLVNGIPSPMERRVYVKFDIPGNDSFEELAKDRYFNSIKYFSKAMYLKDNRLITQEKRDKKSTKYFNRSLKQLNMAAKYSPNNYSIAHWKAKNYEQLNMEKELRDILDESVRYLSMKKQEQTLTDHYNLAIIER